MWRYRELLPLFDGETPVTLGEGFTPLFHARALGATLGLDRLYIKDESLNPTNSFKARGQSAAITRASYLGAKTIALPTAGNAGNAAAALPPRPPAWPAKSSSRGTRSSPFVDECRLYGANVTLVDGLITDAGRLAAEQRRGRSAGTTSRRSRSRIASKARRRWPTSCAEQMDWRWPDWIVYPTGGGTGMIGMWKAFEEIERIGWVRADDAAAHGVGAGRGLRADRPRLRAGRREGAAVGRRRDARRRACACRARSATS